MCVHCARCFRQTYTHFAYASKLQSRLLRLDYAQPFHFTQHNDKYSTRRTDSCAVGFSVFCSTAKRPDK